MRGRKSKHRNHSWTPRQSGQEAPYLVLPKLWRWGEETRRLLGSRGRGWSPLGCSAPPSEPALTRGRVAGGRQGEAGVLPWEMHSSAGSGGGRANFLPSTG